MVPNFKIKTILHLQSCGDALPIIRALNFFQWSLEMTVFAHGVDAIVRTIANPGAKGAGNSVNLRNCLG